MNEVGKVQEAGGKGRPEHVRSDKSQKDWLVLSDGNHWSFEQRGNGNNSGSMLKLDRQRYSFICP